MTSKNNKRDIQPSQFLAPWGQELQPDHNTKTREARPKPSPKTAPILACSGTGILIVAKGKK